jgi:hypothetical protein
MALLRVGRAERGRGRYWEGERAGENENVLIMIPDEVVK